MKQKTVLAGDLEAAGMIARYDEHAKRIIRNKSVLARILKSSVEEFREFSVEEIEQSIEPDIETEGRITGSNTEDKVPGEGTIYYDVRKVYSIWLCMDAPDKIGNAMTEYHLCENNVIGNMHEEKEHYDKFSVIIICLNEKMEAEEGGIHDFLNVLFSTRLSVEEKKLELESRFGMKMSRELMEGEGKDMCNLGEAIYEKGIRQGMEQGEERVSRLNLILIGARKFTELERASKDAIYRGQLFKEYGI